MSEYVIKGGVAGRERLRMLARVMLPSTSALLDRLGPLTGLRCLDAGSGGGDVTRELARRAGPQGRVVGADFDDAKLALARSEAEADGVTNVEFRKARIGEDEIEGPFDVVYSRFLLTHLQDPQRAVAHFYRLLRTGGAIAVEDIDFSGHFVHPDSEAHRRYVELYSRVVRHNGADPNIGPRLPLMLAQQGFTGISVSVAQPMALQGEAKLITPMTMENIADAVVDAGFATRGEVASLTQQLYDHAADTRTLSGLPRVVQVWGRK
jgi:SAM-dependent methyltransferase